MADGWCWGPSPLWQSDVGFVQKLAEHDPINESENKPRGRINTLWSLLGFLHRLPSITEAYAKGPFSTSLLLSMLYHGSRRVSRAGSVLQPRSGIFCESRSVVPSSRDDCPHQAASSLLGSLHPHGIPLPTNLGPSTSR